MTLFLQCAFRRVHRETGCEHGGPTQARFIYESPVVRGKRNKGGAGQTHQKRPACCESQQICETGILDNHERI